MSKNDLKAVSSPMVLDAFSRRAAELSIQEQLTQIIEADEEQVDELEETSVLLCAFLIEAIKFGYNDAADLLDAEIDHDEESGIYYAFLSPREKLTAEQIKRGFAIRDEFMAEINDMDLNPNEIAVQRGSKAIIFSEKISLLVLISSYLKTKGVPVFTLTDIDYDNDGYGDIWEAAKGRSDQLKQSRDRGNSALEENPGYIKELMMSCPMRPYPDEAGFVATAQDVRDVFSLSASDQSIVSDSIIMSNCVSLIGEKIRLENRNDKSFVAKYGSPKFMIN